MHTISTDLRLKKGYPNEDQIGKDSLGLHTAPLYIQNRLELCPKASCSLSMRKLTTLCKCYQRWILLLKDCHIYWLNLRNVASCVSPIEKSNDAWTMRLIGVNWVGSDTHDVRFRAHRDTQVLGNGQWLLLNYRNTLEVWIYNNINGITIILVHVLVVHDILYL